MIELVKEKDSCEKYQVNLEHGYRREPFELLRTALLRSVA
jgi:hypothetical protein